MTDIAKTAENMSILALAKLFYQTIDTQQWDAQETLVSNDFMAILGSTIRVPFKTWQEKLKGIYKAFPDGRHHLDFYLVEGDRILTVGRFAGTHQDEFMGQPATGKRIEMGVMHLDSIIGNQIVQHTAGADLLGLLNQIRLNA